MRVEVGDDGLLGEILAHVFAEDFAPETLGLIPVSDFSLRHDVGHGEVLFQDLSSVKYWGFFMLVPGVVYFQPGPNLLGKR